MSFNFPLRTAAFGVFKNLYEKDEDEEPSGAVVPVTFSVSEEDLIRLIPTPRADDPEFPFPTIVDFLFSGEDQFMYPCLPAIPVDRRPSDLEVVIYHDATDERKKTTIRGPGVCAHSIVYFPASGAQMKGTVEMKLKMPHLNEEQFIVIRDIQKKSRAITITALQNDLFDEKPPVDEDESKADLDAADAKKQASEPAPPKKPAKKAAKKTTKKAPAKKSTKKKAAA